ncbi:hypothetical protein METBISCDRAFT_13362 [Metschnikowia bicuspidata]|uniref:Uncharacterized protein n=1 Tax=Metschnikowia bicuspidata TaxID=27322 RepID=A0A4P9ZG04_9ASCO|nr:hypothetical protein METBISCDRAFT_13362 [Metschnikowia bicuspidata]
MGRAVLGAREVRVRPTTRCSSPSRSTAFSPNAPRTAHMPEPTNRWTAAMVSGGNPLVFRGPRSFPAVASADGKHSIIFLSRQLRVYYVQTRQCVHTVDVDLREVVAACLDLVDASRIVCFTKKDVFYVVWKETVASPVVATLAMAPPVEGFVDVFKNTPDCYFALAESESVLSVLSVDRETANTCVLFEVEGVHTYATSRDGHKLAVVQEAHALLYDLSAAVCAPVSQHTRLGFQEAIDRTRESHAFSHKAVSCLAVSKSGVMVLGTVLGPIQVLYGGTRSGIPRGFLRWHIDPVKSVEFSIDENYLVSGGSEKVLVFWHLLLDRAQFLPRLAGPIERIFMDTNRPDHYSVSLRMSESASRIGVHEILVILGLDLVSRLSYSPVCASYHTPLAKALNAARKRRQKDGTTALTLDITAKVVVHPTTKHLYTARGSMLQAYDLVKGEQAFVQHIAPKLSTGKVRNEKKLVEPEVRHVCFTSDGAWMATFDSMPSLNFDNLMSKDDTSYALKFWQWKDSEWVLTLKVVDPHGAGHEIGCLLSNSADCITSVDTRGGIRLWRPRQAAAQPLKLQIGGRKNTALPVWTLRRASLPSTLTAPVCACYAPDGSFLVVSHGNTARIYVACLLLPMGFSVPPVDLSIEGLATTDVYLVITSQLKLLVYDLVRGCETPLFVRVFARGMGNLVAVDPRKRLVAVAYNDCDFGVETTAHSTVHLFLPHQLVPVYSFSHHKPIASLVPIASGFLFINTDSEVGVLAPEAKKSVGKQPDDDLAAQMNKMLINAQAAANVLHARTVNRRVANGDVEDKTKYTAQSTVDAAVLQSVFSNSDGVGLDLLFEKVVRVLQ